MSDPKKIPDDFDKTTPNIPRSDSGESADWEKTNYNARFAPQPPADDWGKTVTNVPPIKNDSDFDKTHMPGKNAPSWGVTEQNIRLPQDDFGGGRREDFSATTPFIKLPEHERQRLVAPAPTPTEAAKKKEKEEKEKGGIPGWFWASLALMGMFFIALIGIAAAYFIFLRPSGFDLVVVNPQPGSKVIVDGIEWSVTEGDGSLIARGLKSNELKKIDIKVPGFVCESREVRGNDGETIRIPARCTPSGAGNNNSNTNGNTNVNPPDECKNLKAGDFATAQRCANQALDGLKEPYSAEDIAAALNLYKINFAVNKFDIPEKDMVFLEKASKFLKKLPDTTIIEVGGHTDSDGTDQKNQQLSDNRAKSVRDALVGKFGVNPNMLTQKGYGESRPMPGNQNRNPDEKFQNRRIEYSVIRK